jgi:uncharacterized membrane protein
VKRLRQWFLAGLLWVAPLVITGWVLLQVYHLVDRTIRPLLDRIPALRALPGFFVTLAGVAAFLLLIMVAGVLAQNVFGVAMYAFLERTLRRVPFVRVIFDATKQIGEVLLNPRSNAFKRVVVFEWPRPGVWTFGFVTADDGAQDLVTVMLPTVPNPATGFILLLPRADIRVVPLSIEEGVRLVISGGTLLSSEQARALCAGAAELAARPDAGPTAPPAPRS